MSPHGWIGEPASIQGRIYPGRVGRGRFVTTSLHADKVFKALGDPTRRKLLDLLCEKNGQTLGQLCENLDMARQSATQHLGILEAANLVSTVRRGREKLHFINPVPLHEVYERWVRKFEHQRLSLLHDLKKELEGE